MRRLCVHKRKIQLAAIYAIVCACVRETNKAIIILLELLLINFIK